MKYHMKTHVVFIHYKELAVCLLNIEPSKNSLQRRTGIRKLLTILISCFTKLIYKLLK